VAIADALGVSVDYLVGGRTAVSHQLLEHSALLYRSDDEFMAACVPFLAEGVARDESVLVVAAKRKLRRLRDALGDDAGKVNFRDSALWLRTPAGTLHAFRAFINDSFDRAAPWVRIVGEPIWTGRSEGEVEAWTRFESMFNVAFGSSPATVMCPYDARSLPDTILADAQHTHPEIAEAGAAAASSTYVDPEDFLLSPG
jgi:hypothetical protein